MANKRIMKVRLNLYHFFHIPSRLTSWQEFQENTSNAPPGCSIKLAKEDDMNLWDVVMDGPAESVYAVCCRDKR
jgi:hypothetical protein